MSIMNSAEAARLALDEAAQHLNNVIVIYVEPDRTAKPLIEDTAGAPVPS